MTYSVPIPNTTGTLITQQTLSQSQKQRLQSALPEPVILRIYGTVGAGKGTIASELAEFFSLPNLDSGKIWRAVTFGCIKLGLDPSAEHTQAVFSMISIKPRNGIFDIYFQDTLLLDSDLRGPQIDPHIPKYSIYRESYNHYLSEYLITSKKSLVLDGRGAATPYLLEAKEVGYSIVPFLLYVSLDEAARRRTDEYIQKKQSNDKDFALTQAEYSQLLEETKTNILQRDQKDYQINIQQNLGWVIPETVLVDTTHLTIPEVFERVLAHLFLLFGEKG